LRRTGGRRLARWALAVCVAFAFPNLELGQTLPLEYQMKAAYLGKIPRFVEWPASESKDRKTAFQFCTMGDYRFGTKLASEIQIATVGGRKIELRWTHNEQELEGCELIFFSRSETARYVKLLEALNGKSVLTIGETKGFLEAGGIMEFSFENDKLQIDVNLVAARKANLKMDARLLALAKRVVTEHGAPGG
jgi:hypothetical protein